MKVPGLERGRGARASSCHAREFIFLILFGDEETSCVCVCLYVKRFY